MIRGVREPRFDCIFDGDKKLKDVAGCFMCKNCVPTHDPNHEFQTSSSINVKLAKRTSPVSAQLKQGLKNQRFVQI
jgi:hypothetical protein